MCLKQRLIFGSVLLSSCISIALGFFIIDLNSGIWLVKSAGYWLIGTTFALFLWHLFQLLKETGQTEWSSFWHFSWSESVAIVLVSLCLWFIMQEKGFKIIMDEPMLAVTAFQMHQAKKANVPTAGYEMDEAFYLIESDFVDKRPLFFPFLVSLLHDFTGYRPLQSVWLNALLTPLFVGLLFITGRTFGGTSGGILAVTLFLTVPILLLNFYGGGFELLNLVMILIVFHLACGYLKAPTTRRLNLLIFGGLLLAQTRYESSLYVFTIGLVILVSWWRMQRVALSWATVLAPLLLICVPLQARIFEAEPIFWQLRDGVGSTFSLEFIGSNLSHAASFFFWLEREIPQPTSVLLSILFCLALLVSFCKLRELHCWLKSPEGLVAASISFVLLLNGGLLMTFHYGQINDLIVTRLILPVLLFQVLYTVRIYTFFKWDRSVTWGICMVLAVYWFGMARPLTARFEQSWPQYYKIAEMKWFQKKLANHRHEAPLFLTDFQVIPTIEQVSSMAIVKAVENKPLLDLYFRQGTFGAIYFVSKAEENPENLSVRIVDERISEHFEYAILDEIKWVDSQWLQFGRLTRVKLETEEPIALDSIQSEHYHYPKIPVNSGN